MERREFLTSMCGLGAAALFPWAWFAESPVTELKMELGQIEGFRWVWDANDEMLAEEFRRGLRVVGKSHGIRSDLRFMFGEDTES